MDVSDYIIAALLGTVVGLWWAVGRGGWWRYILYGCAGLLADLGFGEGLKIMFKILWAMLVRLFYLLFPEMK